MACGEEDDAEDCGGHLAEELLEGGEEEEPEYDEVIVIDD